MSASTTIFYGEARRDNVVRIRILGNVEARRRRYWGNKWTVKVMG
jgi:hypothetical protein